MISQHVQCSKEMLLPTSSTTLKTHRGLFHPCLEAMTPTVPDASCARQMHYQSDVLRLVLPIRLVVVSVYSRHRGFNWCADCGEHSLPFVNVGFVRRNEKIACEPAIGAERVLKKEVREGG